VARVFRARPHYPPGRLAVTAADAVRHAQLGMRMGGQMSCLIACRLPATAAGRHIPGQAWSAPAGQGCLR